MHKFIPPKNLKFLLLNTVALFAMFLTVLAASQVSAFMNEAFGNSALDVDFQKSDLISLTPNPEYKPQEVVRIQLTALARNNDPYKDAGIEITFRFASPSNKQMTGPLDRFIRLLYNPAYSPMLEHRAANLGELVRENDRARLSVILTAADGERVGYLFILSKQKSGQYDQCWMTDSVIRYEVDAV